MHKKFEVIFLEEAVTFLEEIQGKARLKILYNIRKAQIVNDPKLFKKLTSDIWEFRTNYENQQYRLLAFWDKENNQNTAVIATHGIIKKTDKIPKNNIEKAKSIQEKYFETKKG
jgi:phage-related protein